MSALTQDRKTDKLGTEDSALPQLLSFPVEANTTIYGGAMVAVNASGNAVPASSTAALRLAGRCDRQVLNTTAAGFGTAGALMVQVRPGVFFLNNSSGADAIVAGNFGQYCYAVDDQTVALTDGNGTRPLAGVIYGLGETGGLPETGLVAVGIGVPFATPYATNSDLGGATTALKATTVATSIAAYTGTGTGTLTGSSNGALGAQDGITLTAGQVVLFPSTISNVSAADVGPWVVTVVGTGGTKYVLTRPDWWAHGAAIVPAASIVVGAGGTVWPGSTWRVFATGTKVIDTDDPTFYPEHSLFTATLGGGGTVTVSGLYIATTAQLGAMNTTAAHAFWGTPTAGHGTGTLLVTGTASDVISVTVTNF